MTHIYFTESQKLNIFYIYSFLNKDLFKKDLSNLNKKYFGDIWSLKIQVIKK